MANALTQDGAAVDRRVIEMFYPFMDIAVKYMKLEKLSSDQAAVAMIINVANTFQKGGALQKMYDERYDMFISFVRLYHAACSMMRENSNHFRRASLLYDDHVFKSVEEMR